MDSTVPDDAVATQDTATQIIGRGPRGDPHGRGRCRAMHRARLHRPRQTRVAWNDEQSRAQLVDGLVSDDLRLLGHLALLASQDLEPAEDSDRH